MPDAGSRESMDAWLTQISPTLRATLPQVLYRIIVVGWGALILGAAALALVQVTGWTPAIVLTTVALLIAVEETTHLLAGARVSPASRLTLVSRPPLRLVTRIDAVLSPQDAAAVALAGPVAASLAGFVTITLPWLALTWIRGDTNALYHPSTPVVVQMVYVVLSALPLPGTDAAIARAARRALPSRRHTHSLVRIACRCHRDDRQGARHRHRDR